MTLRHAVTVTGLLVAAMPGARGDASRTVGAPAVGRQVGAELDRIVTRFIAGTQEYERTFRDLVADETKIIEVFKASGAIDKRREVVSDLLVYSSSRLVPKSSR